MSKNGYQPITERIDLGDGQWWEIYAVMTRGMRKQVDQYVKATNLAFFRDADVDMNDDAARTAYVMEHYEEYDDTAEEDAWLLYGTHGLSIKDGAGKAVSQLTPEVLALVPDWMTDKVLTRMRELYRGLTEDEGKGSDGTPSPTTTATQPSARN